MISFLWYESSPKSKSIQISGKPEGACFNHFLVQGAVLQYPFYITLELPRITQIVANDDSVLALSESGLVFGWGGNCSGLLDSSQTPVPSPKPIPNLINIAQISISTSHAGAIDSQGLLYTWGCPLNNKLGHSTFNSSSTPTLVLSSRIFKSIQLVCGPKFTAIRTDGCYVHLYGELGYSHAPSNKLSETKSPKSSGSYSHPELDKHSIVSISSGANFLVNLTDNGEVFVFDGCMDVVKLPIQSETRVSSIIAGEKVVWGLSSSYLYKWKMPLESRCRNYCELASWTGDVYEPPEHLQIFSWGTGFLLSADSELGEFIFQLRPYKRSEYARKLFSNALESPSISMVKEDRVPVINFEDLERLFPNGDSQHTMEKIIKIRVEHYKREVILKAFKPLVHPVADFAFNKIKEVAWRMHLYRKTLKVSNLVGIFNSYLKQQVSMMKLKFLWRLKALNRIHGVITRNENVKKLEKSCEVLRNHFELITRDVFTAIKIRKPLKVIEAFRVKMNEFVRKDILIAFAKWVRKLKQSKKCIKILRIFRGKVIKKSFNRMKNQVSKIKKQLNSLQKALKIHESLTNAHKKQAFGCFRSNLNNTVLLKFHKKYVLELFLKLLLRTLSRKLYSIYTDSFHSLQSYNKPRHFKTPLFQFLIHLSLKLKNLVFKSLTSPLPKDKFSPLKRLLKSNFKSVIAQFDLVYSSKRLKNLAIFSLTVQKILSNCVFKRKLNTFYLLQKRNLSRCHSLEDIEQDSLVPIFDSSSEISKRSTSRQHLDPYFTTSADVKLRPGRSTSSPNAVRRSHCCFRGSPAYQSPSFKQFRFYKGEKITYERYLVLKKIDELKEPYFKSTLSPLNTPKKKKSGNSRPPWKPASVYAHSSQSKQRRESALLKGIKYNESLRRKLMKQRNSNELSETKQSVIINDKGLLINKPFKKSGPDQLNNIVSLPICKDTLSIGLASMILDRASKKVQKRLVKDTFNMLKYIKALWKRPAPTPIDSPKPVCLKDTLDMIKLDWQLGIVVIAADKTRLIMRKVVGKDLFKLFR